jgi:Tfp pilus assembly protein PilF
VDHQGYLLRTGIVALTLLLAGCATATSTPPTIVANKPAPLTVGERSRKAVEFLTQGHPQEARIEVLAVLGADPHNRVGRSLLAQIDQDPKALLGAKSFPYKVKHGDTLPGLAGRFLGDTYLFYALARYNGIAVPAQSQVGGFLQIPGTPKPPPTLARKRPAAPKADPTITQSTIPPRDPARATKLRAAGLAKLQGGEVATAVGLLRQASQEDPTNTLVSQDLARALRIQATVRAR